MSLKLQQAHFVFVSDKQIIINNSFEMSEKYKTNVWSVIIDIMLIQVKLSMTAYTFESSQAIQFS